MFSIRMIRAMAGQSCFGWTIFQLVNQLITTTAVKQIHLTSQIKWVLIKPHPLHGRTTCDRPYGCCVLLQLLG